MKLADILNSSVSEVSNFDMADGIDDSGILTFPELFDQVVAKVPNHAAVRFEDQCLTYKKLSEQAEALKDSLLSTGRPKGSIVGVIIHPSLEMIVSVLGIIKAGFVYMPINQDLPPERLRHMIEDGSPSMVISWEEKADQSIPGLEFPFIETLPLAPIGGQLNILRTNLECAGFSEGRDPNEPMYIIYTSGSSGLPKGVLVGHQSFGNLMRHTAAIQAYNTREIGGLVNAFSFDPSMLELGAMLSRGGCLVIQSKLRFDPEEFSNYLLRSCLTSVVLIPSVFNALAQYIEHLRYLKYLIMGGEQVSVNHLSKLFEVNDQVQVWNMYGPTESTVAITQHLIDRTTLDKNYVVPIGRPLSNNYLEVRTENGLLAADQVPGELYVLGNQLAHGYLNQPELTRERFTEKDGERSYRTGDLVKRLASGEVIFLGRVDRQVKVRGFRVEIGEIESQINEISEVRDAAVTIESSRITAYYLADEEIERTVFISILSKMLPGYMLPLHYRRVDAIPITPNGKTDYQALSERESDELELIEKPKNKTEAKVLAIWVRILALNPEEISTQHSFFEIGGDSLSAISLSHDLESAFGVKFSIREIFKKESIVRQAGYLQTILVLKAQDQEESDLPVKMTI